MNQPRPSSPSLFEELHELIVASLADEMTAEQQARLESLVCENAEARRMYVLQLNDSTALRWWVGEPAVQTEVATQAQSAVAARAALTLSDLWLRMRQSVRSFATSTRFMWLMLGVGATAVEAAVILFLIAPRTDSLTNTGIQADVVAEASSVDEQVQQPVARPVARVIRMVECNWVKDSEPSLTGEVVEGTDLWLTSGFAELEFRSGARVVLQGPAWLTPQSVGNGYLHQGRLTARIPQSAKGFTIETPSGKVIDLGTEFGVHVDAAGEVNVRVFEGQVEAVPLPRDNADTKPVLLVAGQTARMAREVQIQTVAEVGTGSGEFVRWIPSQGRFPLFASGRGLEEDAIDTHWQICHESAPSDFKPARVVRGNAVWLPNDHYSSQWLSLADGESPLPAGRYTFRTQFDLSKYDIATAQIVGRWMADNRVEEIRLNWEVVSQGPEVSGFGEFKQFNITGGFVPGMNTVDFIVQNDGSDPMGFRVEWYGLAKPKAELLDQMNPPAKTMKEDRL